MKNNALQVDNLLDLNETIAASLFNDIEHIWDVIPRISDYIVQLGSQLSDDDYRLVEENTWISKTAQVATTASITGPAIIGHNAQIRHCAFIRGNAIIGNNSIVGNSSELKNVILFNDVQVPHFNYVGDSILGHKSHMGAGAITSNVKSDKSDISIKLENEIIETQLRKFGTILGDGVEIGSNSVLNPGTIIGRNASVYPLSSVRGYVPQNTIYKNQNEIVLKR